MPGATTTTEAAGARALTEASTGQSIGLPATGCSTLGRSDFMRLPFPAARTTTASLRADMVEPEQCKDGRSERRGAAEGSTGGGRRRQSRKLWTGQHFPLTSTFVASYYNPPAHPPQPGTAQTRNRKTRTTLGTRPQLLCAQK